MASSCPISQRESPQFVSDDPLFTAFGKFGLVDVPAETRIVQTWFRATICWEPRPTPTSIVRNLKSPGQYPKPPDKPVLEFAYKDDDGVEYFQQTFVFGETQAEAIPNGESLLSVRARHEDQWSLLELTWSLIRKELEVRNRIRLADAPSPGQIAPKPEAKIQVPTARPPEKLSVSRRRALITELHYEGNTAEEISGILEDRNIKGSSVATIRRDLKELGLVKPRPPSKTKG